MCLGYVLFILSLFRLYLWFFIEGSVELEKFMHKTIKKIKFNLQEIKFKDQRDTTNNIMKKLDSN